MKIIAIEEHFLPDFVQKAWKPYADEDPTGKLNLGEVENRLEDVADARIQLMDETGVDVQVLSLTSPGLHNLKEESVHLARETNDFLYQAIQKHPHRFQGMAALPTPVPKAIPKELERCVQELDFKAVMLSGRTRDKNLDHNDFRPMFETAAALGIPIQIHPQIPQKQVCETYYNGFDDFTNLALSTFGLGWHYEAGIQFVRLVVAGVFDQFPKLQVILGHWGEVVLFYAERMASLAKIADLKHPFMHYVQHNLYVTASGMFSERYLQMAKSFVGSDRILFSQDYPYQYREGKDARNFVESVNLDQEEKEKFVFANWGLLTGKR